MLRRRRASSFSTGAPAATRHHRPTGSSVMRRLRHSSHAAAIAAALTLTPPALAAQAFDFEGPALVEGYFGALSFTAGSQTLTVTADGDPSGMVYIGNPFVPALGARAVMGTRTDPLTIGGFVPL